MADGSNWEVIGSDPGAASLVAKLLQIMRVESCRQLGQFIVVVTDPKSVSPKIHAPENMVVYCPTVEREAKPERKFFTPILRPIALHILSNGGLLVHGGLIELGGKGAILTGRSGAGKSTACKRVPPPGKCLCDDSILLVRDPQGTFWAHPLPTWSALAGDEQDCSWDVQHAVRVEGIFFIRQSAFDRAEPISREQAICLLVKVCEQGARNLLGYENDKDVRQSDRMRRFESVCDLAQTVPGFILDVTLNGPYWQEIERAFEYRRA